MSALFCLCSHACRASVKSYIWHCFGLVAIAASTCHSSQTKSGSNDSLHRGEVGCNHSAVLISPDVCALRKSWSKAASRLQGLVKTNERNAFAKTIDFDKATVWSCWKCWRFREHISEGLVSVCGGSTRHALQMWRRCGSPQGGLQPGLKLRRQWVKGTSPLVYSDSYHSLSFVRQYWDPVTAVPLTSNT